MHMLFNPAIHNSIFKILRLYTMEILILVYSHMHKMFITAICNGNRSRKIK